MKLTQNIIYFLAALFLHILLLYLFVSSMFSVYFFTLLGASYLLHRYYKYFSYKFFFSLSFLVISLINLDVCDECVFEIYLYFDAVDKRIFINSEVMYVLSALHLIVLINLKKFENFWAIIDKNLFRI
jgi:hypothetical protein